MRSKGANHGRTFRWSVRLSLILLAGLSVFLIPAGDRTPVSTRRVQPQSKEASRPVGAATELGQSALRSLPLGRVTSPSAGLRKPDQATRARLIAGYGRLPLSFEANAGQVDSQVRFLSRGRGYTLFLTGDEAVLALRKASQESKVEGQELVAQRSPFNAAAFRGTAPYAENPSDSDPSNDGMSVGAPGKGQRAKTTGFENRNPG